MIQKKMYPVRGMTCSSCEVVIGKGLGRIDGVKAVTPNHRDNSVEVEFDSEKVSEETIRKGIEEAGYSIGSGGKSTTVLVLLGAIAIFIGLYFAIESFGIASGMDLAKLDANTSYLLLFGVGLVTGLHCIAMCGGFVLSYSLKEKTQSIRPHLSYGAGKLISYTALGAFFGLLGSFIAFTVEMRIAIALIAGLFLVAYGLGNLNLLPKVLTSRLRLPSPIARLRDDLVSRGPFATGIATGFFIACGPLQAMYVLAAGSGSPVFGAMALFFFGLGTLPVMLGFSYVSSMISQVMAARITRYSGVLIVLLGLVMINNAFVLSGTQLVPSIGGSQLQGGQLTAAPVLYGSQDPGNDSFQTIRMNVTRYGFEPNTFVIKKGVPVKWVINGVELTSCNNEIIVREYGLDIKVKKGEQTIEFTPTRTGTVSWSCWMGMIPGKFIVVEGDASQAKAVKALESGNNIGTQTTGGGSCGVSGTSGGVVSGSGSGSCKANRNADSNGGSIGGSGCGVSGTSGSTGSCGCGCGAKR